MTWLDFAFGGLTTGTVIVGLSTFLGKVWANQILQKDRTKYQTKMEILLEDLRTRSKKELFVHQLQFEKEFEIYKELWEQLIRLLPWVRSFDELLEPALVTERAQELPDIITDISRTVYTNQPFYHPKIFDACESILNSMPDIHTLNKRIDKLRQCSLTEANADLFDKRYDELRNEIGAVCEAVKTVSTLIRKRIWSTGEQENEGQ